MWIRTGGGLISLPAEIPPGSYQLNAGLYLLQTGERLPVRDAEGAEQANMALPLLAIEIK